MRNNVHKPNEETAVIREYASLASQYDRHWVSYIYITATISETQKRLDIKPTDSVLDIGCGTCSLLQAISRKHPSVNLIGLDISEKCSRLPVISKLH